MDMKIKNRHRVKTKDITPLLEHLHTWFPQFTFSKDAVIEHGRIDSTDVILVNGRIIFFKFEGKFYFTLEGVAQYQLSDKYVYVDMGAVRFVTNGADIMAAGIVDADVSVVPKDMVWIGDETHHKPLAVGIATATGEDMINQQKGKVIKNIHYVGDWLWDVIKSV